MTFSVWIKAYKDITKYLNYLILQIKKCVYTWCKLTLFKET